MPGQLPFLLVATWVAAAGCGRSEGVTDEQLGALVLAPTAADAPIDVARAASDPAELGRALGRLPGAWSTALGPHTTKIDTTSVVTEGTTTVSELTDQTAIELGDKGAFHAVYTNSADYGREVTFVDGRMYLRPRFQRWHGRAPEAPDEPAALRDQYAGAIAATWDLLAPAVELSDRGAVQIEGRVGRRIDVKRSPAPVRPPAERIAQRQWRETRTIDAVTGEVVLDAATGVPLRVKLAGTVGFARDGRRFAMKLSVDSAVSSIGKPAAIVAPPAAEVVATPERLREVDDRDFLLQGIAPPIRRNADGTAASPQPPTPRPTTREAAP